MEDALAAGKATMDDDARTNRTDRTIRSTEPGAAGSTDAPPARADRAWLRRLGLGLVAVLIAVPIGLQFQVAAQRDQAARSEAAQHRAERDERSARKRLSTVHTRVLAAQVDEADAKGVLETARTNMRAQGLEESALETVHDQTERHVKDLRAQAAVVAAAVTEQERVQPAAESCLFDLLRALGRGRSGGTEPPSGACAAVAPHRPGAG
jgi:hypothetical protein